jgi:hypothetical protein
MLDKSSIYSSYWSDGSVPHRSCENSDAEPENRSNGGRAHVQKQLGLLQESDPTRRVSGAVSRPGAAAGGRVSRESHQVNGVYLVCHEKAIKLTVCI